MTGEHAMQIRPRSDLNVAANGRSVLVTGVLDGQIREDTPQGLFVHETRMLSRYGYRIEGESPEAVTLSNINRSDWMGYYIHPPIHGEGEAPEQAIELLVRRFVGDGLREEIELTNFTQKRQSFKFMLDIDADFADQTELESKKRKQYGEILREWRANPKRELRLDYRASHHYSHQGDRGESHIHRGLVVGVIAADSAAEYHLENLVFQVDIDPLASWRAQLRFSPYIADDDAAKETGEAPGLVPQEDGGEAESLSGTASFDVPGSHTLSSTVLETLRVGAGDLAALRLRDLDSTGKGWTVAAGYPNYVGLFGRDTLITGWHSAPLTSRMELGAVYQIARRQTTNTDDWRDEQPMRLLHQAHTGPVAALNFNPHRHYYGTITAPAFFPLTLVDLWRWTGNKEIAGEFAETAIKALKWLDRYTNLRDDGFYYYQTRSEQGVRNQAWKDSGQAMVHEDGSQAETPIAAAEIQGFVYCGKICMSEMLWCLNRTDEAKTLHDEARELKKRFNDRFWMPDVEFLAMGLDKDGRQIKSISSNPAHCLTSGIVDASLARRIADRLFADDMFSGWGMRTLSSKHPAYNPYSYQRGTVWPFEQTLFAKGLWRYGYFDLLERLAKAYFESAELFASHRFPEVFSGQPRDSGHPFPSIYPKAQWLQAWSAASAFGMLQAMLGIYPYAPMHTLMVDPHLPEWLPEITVSNLKVGDAAVDIRFSHNAEGSGDYEIVKRDGKLSILREPGAMNLLSEYGLQASENLEKALSATGQVLGAEE